MSNSERLPRIGTAEVFAHFYDRANGRLLVLVHNEGAEKPWVVAYVSRLTDEGWGRGRHCATYEDAAEAWYEKVHTIMFARGITPSV